MFALQLFLAAATRAGAREPGANGDLKGRWSDESTAGMKNEGLRQIFTYCFETNENIDDTRPEKVVMCVCGENAR